MPPPISDHARPHLHWALTDGVGPTLFRRIVERFGSAEKALGASASDLASVERIGRDSADRIARGRDGAALEEEIETAADARVRIICPQDEGWPVGLREIPDPPIVLYVLGELRATDAIAIAVVGTRRCTVYGSEQARRFGELLAGVGFTVVSGLARGIDAFAHHGAVDAGGRSVAVFGNGLGQIYPPENEALAHKLLERGAWISELPMRSEVRRENFSGRNRIIAGMALGTLVVEAPKRSGALITARHASDYNREVFAVPGRISEPSAFGTNALIRDGGAKLVTCLEDILDELGDVGAKLKAQGPPRAEDRKGPAECAPEPSLFALSENEKSVFDAIGSDEMLADAVIQQVDLPPGDVLAALTSLELKGLIRRLPGQRVARRKP
jgi:DNA processing protein